MTEENGTNGNQIGCAHYPFGFKDMESGTFAELAGRIIDLGGYLHLLDSLDVIGLHFKLVLQARPVAIINFDGLVIIVDESVFER